MTLEGGEGCGKSTQAQILGGRLRRIRVPFVHTRKPGGTTIAEAVRRVLLHPESRIDPLTELLLYEAARAQHLAEIVRPALAGGRVVLCERYTDATEAYQGYGRGLDLRMIRLLNKAATGGLVPDRTFLLDSPVGGGLARARNTAKALAKGHRPTRGGDRIEREPESFHQRVRAGYLRLARREPSRFRVVPWGGSVEAVADILWKDVQQLLRIKP